MSGEQKYSQNRSNRTCGQVNNTLGKTWETTHLVFVNEDRVKTMRQPAPHSSEFVTAAEPLSPPHADDEGAQRITSWAKIATEQLRLLDDLQCKWEDLRQREADLQAEQERWAEWRTREEDALEEARRQLNSWVVESEQDIARQRAEFARERDLWKRQKYEQEQHLIETLNDLKREGDALQRRRDINPCWCSCENGGGTINKPAPVDSKGDMKRELAKLKRTLRLKDAELHKLQSASKRQGLRCGSAAKRLQQEDFCALSTSPKRERSADIPSIPDTPPAEPSSKCMHRPESAPPVQSAEQGSPTLRVKHIEKGPINRLSILWQGRSPLPPKPAHPETQPVLPLMAHSRVARLDQDLRSRGRQPVARESIQVSTTHDTPETFAPDPRRLNTRPLALRNATVDLGDLYRGTVITPMSSNTTSGSSPKERAVNRRASDILAGLRSPASGQQTAPSVARNFESEEDQRFRRLQEGLRQRVHHL